MKFSLVFFTIAAGQDLFLAPLNATTETDVAGRRRRRRRSTVPATCFGDDLPTCVNQCLTNDESANFKKCVGVGSNSCADSQCCTKPGWSCFVKNAYWSSCAPACKTGVKDSRGDLWDCTAVSPSNCATLSTCVKGCHAACPSQELEKPPPNQRPTRGPDPPDRGSAAPACRGGSMQECKKVCHYGDEMLTKLCNLGCEETCPLEPEKHCPKENMKTCVASCEDDSKGPQHDDKCEKDGATNCLHSRCCQNPSDNCFTKNPYWAACTGSCPKGEKNPLDNQFWDCKELKPRVTCDAWKYRTCVSTCATECE